MFVSSSPPWQVRNCKLLQCFTPADESAVFCFCYCCNMGKDLFEFFLAALLCTSPSGLSESHCRLEPHPSCLVMICQLRDFDLVWDLPKNLPSFVPIIIPHLVNIFIGNTRCPEGDNRRPWIHLCDEEGKPFRRDWWRLLYPVCRIIAALWFSHTKTFTKFVVSSAHNQWLFLLPLLRECIVLINNTRW